jgi:hypothetical protein
VLINIDKFMVILKKFSRNIPIILFFGSLILLCIIFYWRFRIGIVRYFDSDEFMYPNWAYHTMIGNQPYLDFMLLVTPLFVITLIPVFWFFHGSDVMTILRIMMFVLTIANSLTLVWLFYEARKSWVAITAAIFFIVLPMPLIDKLLEIRPENLSILFLLLGLIFQIRFMNRKKIVSIFLSGIFYSLSILTLQKTLPYVFIALLISLTANIKQLHRNRILNWPFILHIAGFIIPILLFVIWAVFSGNPKLVIYSITQFPLEMAKGMGSSNAILDPLFYFRQNINYFGDLGDSLGYRVNTALWIIGLIIAGIRLILLLLPRTKNKLQEILILGIFTSTILIYFKFTPLKYPQYLMPAALFVAFYCTDAVYIVWNLLKDYFFSRLLFLILYAISGLLMYQTYMFVISPKFTWHNKIYYDWMNTIYATVPKNEKMLDLTGISLYYPYPYYMCCMAIGNFQQYVSYPLPSLREALKNTRTKYIYAPAITLTNAVLPNDREFIENNYNTKDNGLIWMAKYW